MTSIQSRFTWYFVIVLLVASCQSAEEVLPDDIPILEILPPVNPIFGKLSNLNIERFNPDLNYKYAFFYDEHTGKLLNIESDGSVILTINYISEDSIHLDWNDLDNPVVSQEWLVILNSDDKLSQIWLVNYFIFPDPVIWYLANYDSTGSFESFYEPGVPPTVSGVKNYNYSFQDGNCIHYVYEFSEGPEPTVIDVFPEYSSSLNTKYVPRQKMNVALSHGISHSERFLDPLYVLGMIGVECIPQNQNLVISQRNRFYEYDFDNENRVTQIVEFLSGDTLAIHELCYYD